MKLVDSSQMSIADAGAVQARELSFQAASLFLSVEHFLLSVDRVLAVVMLPDRRCRLNDRSHTFIDCFGGGGL